MHSSGGSGTKVSIEYEHKINLESNQGDLPVVHAGLQVARGNQ